jgi:hypothetical protein
MTPSFSALLGPFLYSRNRDSERRTKVSGLTRRFLLHCECAMGRQLLAREVRRDGY